MATFNWIGAEGLDPLGLWAVTPAPVSFGGGIGAPLPAGGLWEIRLPADPLLAEAELERTARQLADGSAGIAQAQDVLERLNPGAPIAYSLDPTLSAAQLALLDAVQQLKSPAFRAFGGDPEESALLEQWSAFVAQVQQVLSCQARIQSYLGAEVVGVTEVSWLGDFQTTWQGEVTAETRPLHCRTVALALQSRLAWARLMGVVVTGAAGLAVKASVPGGVLLLAPAVWRFVRDFLQELRRFKASQSSEPVSV